MIWFPNAAQWISWACAVGAVGLLTSVAPLRADDPATSTPSETAQPHDTQEIFDAYLSQRNLTIVRQAALDLDGDGVEEVVAHVVSSKGQGDATSRPFSALMVAAVATEGPQPVRIIAEIPDGMLCPDCAITTPDGGQVLPEQTLRAVGRNVEICEAWGSEWRARECDVVEMGPDGTMRVQRHTELMSWKPGPSESSTEVDFANLRGRRSYLSEPQEAGFPNLDRTAQFALIAASWTQVAPELDGQADEPPWAAVTARTFDQASDVGEGIAHWTGPDDLALTVRTTWQSEGLWMAIKVKDDQVVKDGCEPRRPLMQADRVEVWLDVGEGLRLSGNEPSVEEHRRVYHEDPIRHTPDGDMLEFAFGPGATNACVTQYLPRGVNARGDASPDPGGVRAEVSEDTDGTGYLVEAYFPAALFGVSDLQSFEGRWPGAGLTIVVHDVDDTTRPQDVSRLATSSLRWGDPFTLGILVFPRRAGELPAFPFSWADWLR